MRKITFGALMGLAAAVLLTSCGQIPSDSAEERELSQTGRDFRVYGVIEKLYPIGDYDSSAGNECLAVVLPEHRQRKVIAKHSIKHNESCLFDGLATGDAVSFVWRDTTAAPVEVAAAVRASLGFDGAVHELRAPFQSETTAMDEVNQELANILQLSPGLRAQAVRALEQSGTINAKSSSPYYLDTKVAIKYAETIDDILEHLAVIPGCENPGLISAKRLFHSNGFLFGFEFSRQGSCHSGWFSYHEIYGRDFTLLYRGHYGE